MWDSAHLIQTVSVRPHPPRAPVPSALLASLGASPRGRTTPPTPGRERGKLRVSSGAAQRVYQLLLFPRGNCETPRAPAGVFCSAWRSTLDCRSQPQLFQPGLRKNLDLGPIFRARSLQHSSAHICPSAPTRKRTMGLAWSVLPRRDP